MIEKVQKLIKGLVFIIVYLF